MRDAKIAAAATGINLFNAATLIGTHILGRKCLLAGTAITLVGNALIFRHGTNSRFGPITASVFKTTTGFLDLGVFILAKEGLRCFQGGFKLGGRSLMIFGVVWTAWRIGVDILNIGRSKINGEGLADDYLFGWTDVPAALFLERLQEGFSCICNRRQPQEVG